MKSNELDQVTPLIYSGSIDLLPLSLPLLTKNIPWDGSFFFPGKTKWMSSALFFISMALFKIKNEKNPKVLPDAIMTGLV